MAFRVWLPSVLVAGLTVSLVSSPAMGQFLPAATEASSEVQVTLGGGDPRSVAQRERAALTDHQMALIAASPEVERWRTERDQLIERLNEVRALRLQLSRRADEERLAYESWLARDQAYRRALAEAAERRPPHPVALESEPGEEAETTAEDAAALPTEEGAEDAAALPTEEGAEDAAALPTEEGAEDAALLLPEHPGPPPSLSHPAFAMEVAWLESVIERALQVLLRAITTNGELRELVTTGIRSATEVTESSDPGRAVSEAEEREATVTLAHVRTLLYNLYLARLELSLAESRERSAVRDHDPGAADQDDWDSLPPAPRTPELPEDAHEELRATFALAQEIHAEGRTLAGRIRDVAARRRDDFATLQDARRRVARIDAIAKSARVATLSIAVERAMPRIAISEEERLAWDARYAEWRPQVAAELAATREGLARLRDEPVTDGSLPTDLFSRAHTRQVQIAALEEELMHHELRWERLFFVTDTYANLSRMIAGEPPDEAYLNKYERLLDEELLRQRVDEVTRRNEAWRRQQTQLAREPVPPGREEGHRLVLSELQRVVEVVADQEYVLTSQGRLAQIVRYQLERHAREARSFWWYAVRGLFTAAILFLAAFLSRTLGRLSRRAVRRLSEARPAPCSEMPEHRRDLRELVGKAQRTVVFLVYFGAFVGLWLGAVFVAIQLVWGVALGLERIALAADFSLFVVGDTQITPTALLKLVGMIVVASIVARLTQRFLQRQVFQFFDWDEGVRHAISVVLRYVVLFLGVALGFNYVGIGVGAFAVLLGVIGLGIGFGLQTIANNLISGLIILFERPIKKGDFIRAGDLEGEVSNISARATTVTTRDNVSVIIPNKDFISERVVNWSHDDPRVRIKVPVGVAYGSDVAKVERALLDAAAGHSLVIASPEPAVRLIEFGDSAIEFELRAWTTDVRNRALIVSDLNKAIDARFRAEGIEIPFPQRDVHVKSS
jgi:small-conductance mechanosensitive channel